MSNSLLYNQNGKNVCLLTHQKCPGLDSALHVCLKVTAIHLSHLNIINYLLSYNSIIITNVVSCLKYIARFI